MLLSPSWVFQSQLKRQFIVRRSSAFKPPTLLPSFPTKNWPLRVQSAFARMASLYTRPLYHGRSFPVTLVLLHLATAHRELLIYNPHTLPRLRPVLRQSGSIGILNPGPRITKHAQQIPPEKCLLLADDLAAMAATTASRAAIHAPHRSASERATKLGAFCAAIWSSCITDAPSAR